MKRSFRVPAFLLSLLLLVPLFLLPVPAEGTVPKITVFPYTYYSEIVGQNETSFFTWDESWFDRDGTAYNHSLAIASLQLIEAGNAENNEPIEALFDKLGLSYSEKTVCYPTPAFDYDSHSSTVGYAFGSKEITSNGKPCTLVVATVRGGNYGVEWGSNFEIGDGVEHAGFARAADEVFASLSDYLASLPAGNVKVWLTGFSRGAAVSNILAHRLNERIAEGGFALSSPDDLYAYCFECPRSVRKEGVTSVENNIRNIVNPSDPVTGLPPADWDYVRYGVDCVLPAAPFSADYAELSALQKERLTDLLTQTSLGTEEGEKAAEAHAKLEKNQVSFCRMLLTALAQYCVDPSNYAARSEKNACDLIVSLFGGEEFNPLVLLSDEKILSLLLSFGGLHPDLFASLFAVLLADTPAVVNAHYPEYELAWMQAIGGEDGFVKAETRRVVLTGFPDLAVTDGNGKTVASFTEGEADSLDSPVEFFIDENGQAVVLLPTDGAYSLKLTGRDTNKADLLIEEYDAGENRYTRVVGYSDLSLGQGGILFGEIPAASESTAYSLKKSGGEAITPSFDESDPAKTTCRLSLDTPHAIRAVGAGVYAVGETVRIALYDDDDVTAGFSGWFKDGILFSEEKELFVGMDSDLTLSARFDGRSADLNRDGKTNLLDAILLVSAIREEKDDDLYDIDADSYVGVGDILTLLDLIALG